MLKVEWHKAVMEYSGQLYCFMFKRKVKYKPRFHYIESLVVSVSKGERCTDRKECYMGGRNF